MFCRNETRRVRLSVEFNPESNGEWFDKQSLPTPHQYRPVSSTIYPAALLYIEWQNARSRHSLFSRCKRLGSRAAKSSMGNCILQELGAVSPTCPLTEVDKTRRHAGIDGSLQPLPLDSLAYVSAFIASHRRFHSRNGIGRDAPGLLVTGGNNVRRRHA